MNKEEIIHKLSQYDSENFDMGDFYDLFRYGIKGYEYMDEDELEDIYKTIFEQSTKKTI
jgi:hypothetical protein